VICAKMHSQQSVPAQLYAKVEFIRSVTFSILIIVALSRFWVLGSGFLVVLCSQFCVLGSPTNLCCLCKSGFAYAHSSHHSHGVKTDSFAYWMLIPAAPQIQLQYPLSYFRLLPLCANGNNNAPSGILSPREASSSTWQSWAAAAGPMCPMWGFICRKSAGWGDGISMGIEWVGSDLCWQLVC